ncbi:MAG TPA: DMT family transporter [Chloroflexota bacterium]
MYGQRGGSAREPSWLVAAGMLTVLLVWGMGWPIIRLALDSFPPLGLAGTRLLLGGLSLLVLTRLLRLPLPTDRSTWRVLLGTGVLLNTMSPGLVFWGQTLVPAGLASLLYAAMPIFVALLAHRALEGDRLTAERIVGILLGFGGVALVTLAGATLPRQVPLSGMAAILGGAAAWAIGIVWLRRAQPRVHPLVQVAVQTICGGLVLSVASLAWERQPWVVSPLSVAIYVYLLVVQVGIAQTAYVWLVGRVGPNRVAYLSYGVPFVAVVGSNLLLGEVLPPSSLLGGLLLVGGLVLVNRQPSPRGWSVARRRP